MPQPQVLEARRLIESWQELGGKVCWQELGCPIGRNIAATGFVMLIVCGVSQQLPPPLSLERVHEDCNKLDYND